MGSFTCVLLRVPLDDRGVLYVEFSAKLLGVAANELAMIVCQPMMLGCGYSADAWEEA
jgi:hypothetical protein